MANNNKQEPCICEQEIGAKKDFGFGSFTALTIEKQKYGVYIVAHGEGEAEWESIYCPICGRKLLEEK